MRFAPPGSAILKDLLRSPHPTPFAQPTRLAFSQVRFPEQRSGRAGVMWVSIALRRWHWPGRRPASLGASNATRQVLRTMPGNSGLLQNSPESIWN